MGRRGRSHAFLDHWHRRHLELADGATLRWTFMDDRSPSAECFRITRADGTSRGLHATEARRMLVEAGHPDAEYVRVDTHVGGGAFH